LLLKRGAIISSLNQLGRVIEEGVAGAAVADAEGNADVPVFGVGGRRTDYAIRHDGKAVSVFDMIKAVRAATGELIANPGNYDDFGAAVGGIRDAIVHACILDADVALASILIDRSGAYSTRHAVNCAIVAHLICDAHEGATTSDAALIGAALTMNIAMAALQDALHSQDTPLSDAQVKAVHNHPIESAAMLRRLGITDPDWLAIVEQHHESVDGGGTPRGLKDAALCEGARIVALADRYCAAVTGRAYRPGLVPQAVLADIFTKEGRGVSQSLVKLLVREVGIFPPGSIVMLANGDTAVVVKRMPQANQPVVRSLLNTVGIRVEKPLKRLTSDPTFAIKQAVPPDQLRVEIDPALLWFETFELAKPAAQAAAV
jgi:HD-GYP domain-containing protein (c-di-GMP phosphodiesterase class II)